jgi:hypothetical protein
MPFAGESGKKAGKKSRAQTDTDHTGPRPSPSVSPGTLEAETSNHCYLLRDALEWFRSDDTYPGSLCWVSEILQVDIQKVRDWLRQYDRSDTDQQQEMIREIRKMMKFAPASEKAIEGHQSILRAMKPL